MALGFRFADCDMGLQTLAAQRHEVWLQPYHKSLHPQLNSTHRYGCNHTISRYTRNSTHRVHAHQPAYGSTRSGFTRNHRLVQRQAHLRPCPHFNTPLTVRDACARCVAGGGGSVRQHAEISEAGGGRARALRHCLVYARTHVSSLHKA